VVIARTVLFINNLPKLPRSMGFDAAEHEQYIQFIQEKHALPLPKNGWEMHQPPFYYLISATLLDVCGLSVTDDDAAFVLRGVNGTVGLVHCWLALLCFRLLFPKNLPVQAVGLLVAAFLPPHLYLSQYVTNEPLAGLFVTVAFYLCLRALRAERENTYLSIGIGVALGAAVLTKFSSVLALPVFLAALGLRLFLGRDHAIRDWLRDVGMVVLAFLVVSGWHYGRVWADIGKLPMPNWNTNPASAWWQDPGFRTSAYYFNFGQALVSPLFSGFHSFADGIYSTLWGDGAASGGVNLLSRPPWNYDLMNAGYLLGFGISLLFLVGFARVLVRFICQSAPEWFVVVGLVFVFGLGIFYLSLRGPWIAHVKAFYAFPALVPFSVLVAVGWDWLGRKGRILRMAVWVVLLVWTMTVYTAFWVRRENPETPLLRGISLINQRRYAAAVESLTVALQLEERAGRTQTGRQRALVNAVIQFGLGVALEGEDRAGEAMQYYRNALKAWPDFSEALNNLAWLLATSPDASLRDGARAVQLAEHACALTDYRKTFFVGTLAAAYAEAGRFDDAISTAQKACALAEASGEQELLKRNQELLVLYRAHQPYHEAASSDQTKP